MGFRSFFGLGFTFRFMEAAGAATGGGGTGTGTPAQTGTPSGSNTGGSPAPDGGTGTTSTSQPSGSPQTGTPGETEIADGNWKQLRTKYDDRGNKITELTPRAEAFAKIETAASGMATDLGFSAEEFREAFDADPVATVAYLKGEAAKRAATGRQGDGNGQDGQGDIEDRLSELVNDRLKPVTEHVNRQQTEAAMSRYSTELTTAISANSLIKDAPAEVHELVKDYVGEFFASQPGILTAMKTKGDFTAVKETIDFVAGRLQTVFTKWLAQEQAKGGRGAQAGGNQGTGNTGTKKGFTLDDIIDNPAVLGDQYK